MKTTNKKLSYGKKPTVHEKTRDCNAIISTSIIYSNKDLEPDTDSERKDKESLEENDDESRILATKVKKIENVYNYCKIY